MADSNKRKDILYELFPEQREANEALLSDISATIEEPIMELFEELDSRTETLEKQFLELEQKLEGKDDREGKQELVNSFNKTARQMVRETADDITFNIENIRRDLSSRATSQDNALRESFNARLSDFQATIDSLKGLTDNLSSQVEENEDSTANILLNKDIEINKEIEAVKKEIKVLRTDLLAKLSTRGGGNGVPNFFFQSSVMSNAYRDLNIKGSGVTRSINNTTKQVDLTFSGSGGGDLTTTTSIYIDGNRVDSYTATGAIDKPYKTFSAAIAGFTVGSYTGVVFNVAPAAYTEASNVVFPTIGQVTIHGNNASLTINGGAGSMTMALGFDIYSLIIVGSVIQCDTSLLTLHTMTGGTIVGNYTVSGYSTFTNMQTTGGTITVNSGARLDTLASDLATRIVNNGTMFYTITRMSITDNSNYAITCTGAGSVFYASGSIVINLGTGGGINVSNSATTTPNAMSGLVVQVANGTVGAGNQAFLAGTAVTQMGAFSLTTIAGTVLYPSGSQFLGLQDAGVDNSGTYKDALHSAGSAGQYLLSTGTGTQWASVVSGAAGSLTVKEADGTPTVASVQTIIVTNGTLTDNGSGVVTIATGGGGTGIARTTSIITANTAAAATASTDFVFIAAAGMSFTLPDAGGNSNLYTLKNASNSSVLVTAIGGDTIDGSGSVLIAINNQALDFISDGTNYRII